MRGVLVLLIAGAFLVMGEALFIQAISSSNDTFVGVGRVYEIGSREE